MNTGAARPAIEGWYTQDEAQPRLLGSRCTACGTYYFPPQTTFCRNPHCDCESIEADVPLSRTGVLWSYTNACYQPPEPYVAADPFTPFTIAAVRLEQEQMIVLGQVAPGFTVDDLKVGDAMELILGVLHEDNEGPRTIWQWRPLVGAGGTS